MTTKNPGERDRNPVLGEDMYLRMLKEAQRVSGHSLDRLRELGKQLPGGVVEQVERLHENPTHERRKAARLSDPSIPVAVKMVNLPNATDGASMRDHCPTGLAVRLPCPAGEGTVLRVRMPLELCDGGWVAVVVKYCRREGAEWVAGCELLSEQPPL